MQSWQPTIDRRQGPAYLAIADAIGLAIERRELVPGERLPTQRALAAILELDLTTVTRGYAEAVRRGLVEATVGRGTFVRTPAQPAGEDRSLVDMTMNLPPQPPELRTLLQDGLAELLRRAELGSLLAYRVGAGTRIDREAAASWLQPVLGEVAPARILTSAGAQSALTALLTLLAAPGDAVLTERLTYPGLRGLAAQLGVRLVPADSDAEGLLPESVDQLCREARPKAIYCIPTIHNPTTVTMPQSRREALAEVARHHEVPVIEDDAYGLLPSHPLTAIAMQAPGYYIGTLSKCLSPGLRVALLVAPGASEANRLAAALRATSLMPAPLMIGLATQWIRNGTAAAIRDAIREEMIMRQQIARELLPAGSFLADPEGLHVWLSLPEGWNRLDFSAHVRRQGLALVPSDAFAVGPQPPPNAVRIGLGAAETRGALRAALATVAEAIRGEGRLQLVDIV